MKTLIHNARLAGKPGTWWVLVDGERIAQVGEGEPKVQADVVVDAHMQLLLPGAIDCHVHFREPGLTQKADIASESRAALAGGVTSFMDMPNTKPATTTIEAWQQKMDLAAEKSVANYAFFIGATNDNIDQLRRADYSRVPGVKLFMGSSTGNMLVDDEAAITRIFGEVDAIVAVHAEDQELIAANATAARAKYPTGVPMELHSQIRSAEACYRCTKRAIDLARATGHRLHVCHLSTEREIELLDHRALCPDKRITSEVSPHHLLWCDQDYAAKGARIKMNPAVKTLGDREALLEALIDGVIDMVATDHAPHLLADKQGDALTATSGAPLVQFSMPVMLGLIGEAGTQRVMCEAPAKVYGVQDRGRIEVGCYADLVLVCEVEPYVVSDSDVVSKCGWTPCAGLELTWRVEKTWVNGALGYDYPNFLPTKPMPLRFN